MLSYFPDKFIFLNQDTHEKNYFLICDINDVNIAKLC
jgi:hypothetical protein